MSRPRHRLNEPDATSEAFDGEVLVINLISGNYYSLRGTAPLLWSALCNGATVEELTAAAAGRFPATNADQIRQDIGQWVDRLVSDQILTARESGAPETLTVALDEPTEAYAAPTLERYEDMQDLLLLDPIHEVDVTGWPKRPEDSAS